MRYENIQDKYKEFFFGEMKKDFAKMLTHERYNEFIASLDFKNKAIYESCVNSDNSDEFEEKLSKAIKTSKIKKAYNKISKLIKK